MVKKIKKIISSIVPKSSLKEKIKLFYYRFLSNKNVEFNISTINNTIVYLTKFKNTSLVTQQALYYVVADFDFYQHFYKVKHGDVVIDAGANCGHLSIYFSKLVGADGHIYAFEPDKFNIQKIKDNCELNGDLSDNISIEDLLIWNQNTELDFYEAGTVGSSAVWIPDNAICTKKQAITIDDWVVKKNIQKLDFIKMDIEGAEIEALEAIEKTIQQYKPNFAIASYHVVNGKQTYIKVEAFFQKIGYPYKTIRFTKSEIITFAGPSINE